LKYKKTYSLQRGDGAVLEKRQQYAEPQLKVFGTIEEITQTKPPGSSDLNQGSEVG